MIANRHFCGSGRSSNLDIPSQVSTPVVSLFVPSFPRLDPIEAIMKKDWNLTPSSLDTLPEGKHFDPLTPGLCVIVSPSGKKVWAFRRRVAKSGVIVTIRLGAFPAHTIPAAREWAAELNEAI